MVEWYKKVQELMAKTHLTKSGVSVMVEESTAQLRQVWVISWYSRVLKFLSVAVVKEVVITKKN